MKNIKPPPIGSKVKVSDYPAVLVKDIFYDPITDRTKIVLDWGDNRTSYVWLHDENDVWFRYSQSN